MSTTVKCFISIVVGFAICYATMPKKIVTQVVQTDNKKTDVEQNKRKETTTTTKETKDGTKETTTKTVEETNTERKTVDKTRTDSSSTTTYGSSGYGASLLAGTDFSGATPLYGVSVNKNVLGPINLGAFAFKNGMVGLSLGLQF